MDFLDDAELNFGDTPREQVVNDNDMLTKLLNKHKDLPLGTSEKYI